MPKKRKSTHKRHASKKHNPSKRKPSPRKPTPGDSRRTDRPQIFHPNARTLLVGEGDFSFSAALAGRLSITHVTATSLDSESRLLEKYPHAASNLAVVRGAADGVVLHGVDATKVHRVRAVRRRRGGAATSSGEGGGVGFDVIGFMFPHVGGKSTDLSRQVKANQELLLGFFTSAKCLLAPDGVFVVTLFESAPYSLWDLRGLARSAGLRCRISFKFESEEFPGYVHARTVGSIRGGGGWRGEERDSRMFVFELDGGGGGGEGKGKGRKRKKREDSDDDESS